MGKVLLLSIVLLLIAFAGIAIKIWSRKNGRFYGTCSSQNTLLNKDGEVCSFCGKPTKELNSCNKNND